ncbi:MAG: DNA polymerase III subunit delta' [Actinomycetota bacterium]|nr:DNA polymerase III subunit delta' [Actinomycetota bacterium]
MTSEDPEVLSGDGPLGVPLPAPGLFDRVPGQAGAIAALRAASARPVHAYLFVGPPGTGKRRAATAFAAALLCPDGGDATCDSCRRVLAGVHPDLVVVEREGASISVDSARAVSRLAARSPVEGRRKILVLEDFHLVRDAGPALLKTIEEPPPSTVFVVLADLVPPELVTIASRCVRVDFRPIPVGEVAAILVGEGVEPDRAAELAEVADGRLDRARLLAADPEVEVRRAAWRSVPTRLDGTGATAAAVAAQLVGLLEASVAPLVARQAEELADLEGRSARAVAVNGKAGRSARSAAAAGAKDLEARHRREVRRQRTDELRMGLGVLAGAYRDRLVDPSARTAALDAIAAIDSLGRDLAYNPGEQLALEALMLRLGRSGALIGPPGRVGWHPAPGAQ